jgi:hypothetical protein
LRRALLIGTVSVAACAILVGVAAGGKTGNGSSTGTASVFVPNPVQSAAQSLYGTSAARS